MLVLQPSGCKLSGAALQLCQLGVVHTSLLVVDALLIDLVHFLGAKMVHIWVYMAICSHIYMYLHAYSSFIHKLHLILPLCMFICALLLIYMHIYIYAYIGVFWLAFGLIKHHKHFCRPK